MLDFYTEQSVTQGAYSEREIDCVDGNNGFVFARRTLRNPAFLSPDDLLMVRGRSEGRNLRGLWGAFEREPSRLGAEQVVIRGTLADEIFKSAAARALAEKLGYTFQLPKSGAVVVTKIVPK